MMKPLKISLRVWIAASSLLSFMGGWALFSHSGKPAPLFSSPAAPPPPAASSGEDDTAQLAPLPTLQPLPSLDDLTSSGQTQALQLQQPSFSANNNFNAAPRVRTRGS